MGFTRYDISVIDMIKKFKSKKRTFLKIKIFLFIGICFWAFMYSFNYLYERFKKELDEKSIITYLLIGESNHNIDNILNMSSTEFLLNYSLGITPTIKDKNDYEDNLLGDYMADPKPVIVKEPLIYLYNTHQQEAYNKNLVATYNISPTVMLTSYMLRENLNNLGIPTIVETADIKNVLNTHNWIYKDSYKASRLLLDDAYKVNNSLILFIDIHRDSSQYDKTTLKTADASYAKVLFVVGLDYQGYENNLQRAIALNKLINEEVPGISRGGLKKSGKGVNGIYNQDFKENTFLIEVGGQYNSIEEVKNTITPLANAIYNYLKGEDHA